MTAIGTIIEGKYEIQKEIGRGGMSIVYLAMDTRLNKLWAVKEIRKTGKGKSDEVVVNSLLAEANLMKRLDHPALPRIVDIIDNGVTLYIVMDYIEGESLDKILEQYGAQPEEQVIAWSMQICEALGYLHSQKPPIIYRDMKPANVMLKPDGNIKIIDFGIAREYKEQNMTDTKILGTHGYAPPEQYGSWQTDARSDIFALGMTMHHLLTGQDPRPEGYVYQPVRVWNPELSEGIEYIIDKCTQPAATARYQSCDELLFDLQHPDLVTSGHRRKLKKRLAAFIAAAALSVIALIAGVVCSNTATKLNNSTYEAYISESADLSHMDDFSAAIALYPDDPRAYARILESFETEINNRCEDENTVLLEKSEFSKFENLYDPGSEEFAEADAQGFADVNYTAGKMCFTYYTRTLAGDENFRDRINKAYVYLSRNHELLESGAIQDSDTMKLSECYYTICSFYKTYIFSQTADAASSDEFNDFITTLTGMVDSLESNGTATTYDKLVLYNNIFMMLYSRRSDAVSAGADGSSILSLMDTVKKNAETIDTSQRKLWAVLQSEITDNYTEYRSAVQRAFSGAEEK